MTKWRKLSTIPKDRAIIAKVGEESVFCKWNIHAHAFVRCYPGTMPREEMLKDRPSVWPYDEVVPEGWREP